MPGGRVPAAQRGRRDVAGTSAGAQGFPSTSNAMHAARRSGAERRTENAERNSGPFPFVRVRWEQKGDASDPHAAESQPRLTPTTRPDPTTKPRASWCPPVTWHPRGAWGPWPDGPARRQTLPGLSPCLPSPSPPRRALSPRRRFTIYRVPPFFYRLGFSACSALPAPALPWLAATKPLAFPKNCSHCNFQLERSRNRKEGTAPRRTPGGCLPGAN